MVDLSKQGRKEGREPVDDVSRLCEDDVDVTDELKK